MPKNPTVDNNSGQSVSRVSLIETVKTPLGFFVLVVLVVEGVLGSLAMFGAEDRRLLIWGMLLLLGGTIALVGILAWMRPEQLQGIRRELPFSVFVSPPQNLEGLDVASIRWDEEHCFLVGDGVKEQVRLVPSRVGPTLKVHIAPETAERIEPREPYRLDLRDNHGLRWRVADFYFFESLHFLICDDGKERVIEVYGEGYS